MFVRITHAMVRPGMWDAFEEAYREGLQDTSRVPGLEARFLARGEVTQEAEQGYAVSLWSSERFARDYEHSEYLATRFHEALADYLLATSTTDAGPIRLIETYQ